jgi:hypothetical protein
MKTLIYTLILLAVICCTGIGCEGKEDKTYELIYQNGEKEVIVLRDEFISATGYVREGDFYLSNYSIPIRSGVRTFYRIR